jgi:GTP diphosphokinase / guanosine-3',5'-bis(diphosphate) 3'-diphosphatase
MLDNPLNIMLGLIANKFSGALDKGGEPYVLHCLRVMHFLETGDQELLCIALGHDLIEDTDVTAESLRKLGFSERVIRGIIALTKIRGQSADAYLAGVKANPDAIRVKLADLRDNMNLKRLKSVTEKDLARLAKYQAMHADLKSLLPAA